MASTEKNAQRASEPAAARRQPVLSTDRTRSPRLQSAGERRLPGGQRPLPPDACARISQPLPQHLELPPFLSCRPPTASPQRSLPEPVRNGDPAPLGKHAPGLIFCGGGVSGERQRSLPACGGATAHSARLRPSPPDQHEHDKEMGGWQARRRQRSQRPLDHRRGSARDSQAQTSAAASGNACIPTTTCSHAAGAPPRGAHPDGGNTCQQASRPASRRAQLRWLRWRLARCCG